MKVVTKKLSANARRIISLRKKGWGYEDICDEVGVSMSYVYVVLKRAGLVEKRKRKKNKKKKKPH